MGKVPHLRPPTPKKKPFLPKASLFSVFFSYRVAVKGQFYMAAGFSLRRHRLESLCYRLTAEW
jgi:hypothetical protein